MGNIQETIEPEGAPLVAKLTKLYDRFESDYVERMRGYGYSTKDVIKDWSRIADYHARELICSIGVNWEQSVTLTQALRYK